MAINDFTTPESIQEKTNPPMVTLPHVETPIVNTDLKFPTEIVELPSKGLLYDAGSPLSTGKVEMKYMTTKEEDILSTTSYIKAGVVLDKLFQSMLVTKFKYDDLLLGDRNAIMIAARIYGYGPIYETKVTTPDGKHQMVQVDLSKLNHKVINEELINSGTGKFTFTLPVSKQQIEFRLLTVGLQQQIEKSIEQHRKYAGKDTPEENLTTRLRYMITAVDGKTDSASINSLVFNMRVQDSRALREYIGKVQPDADLSIEVVDEATGQPFRTEISLGLDLFWPDYKGQ